MQKEDSAVQELFTAEAAAIPEIPWNVYPRPQMRRERWLCLNGTWELSFKDAIQKIRVPYCPESLLSGVRQKPGTGEPMRYRRTFSVPEDCGACASCCTSAP